MIYKIKNNIILLIFALGIVLLAISFYMSEMGHKMVSTILNDQQGREKSYLFSELVITDKEKIVDFLDGHLSSEIINKYVLNEYKTEEWLDLMTRNEVEMAVKMEISAFYIFDKSFNLLYDKEIKSGKFKFASDKNTITTGVKKAVASGMTDFTTFETILDKERIPFFIMTTTIKNMSLSMFHQLIRSNR